MQEFNVAQEMSKHIMKQLKDLLKVFQDLLLENEQALQLKDVKNDLTCYQYFEKLIKNGGEEEICLVPNLTFKDKQAIESFKKSIGDRGKKPEDMFITSFINVQETALETYTDEDGNEQQRLAGEDKDKYFMVFTKSDYINGNVQSMFQAFKDNKIETDLKLKDVSVLFEGNLFSNIKKENLNEIDIPLSKVDLFNRVKNRLALSGIRFDVATHDNSNSIVYMRKDQKDVLNVLFRDDSLYKELDTFNPELKKLVIVDGDKELNNREKAKENLYKTKSSSSGRGM